MNPRSGKSAEPEEARNGPDEAPARRPAEGPSRALPARPAPAGALPAGPSLPARGVSGTVVPSRTERHSPVIAGELVLTLGSPDGTEVEPCPPDALPVPHRLGPEERASARRTEPGPPPVGSQPVEELPLLEREGDRDRLVRLLAGGRCVRLTARPGAGGSALLRAVADGCADVAAPDGVVRLSAYRRTLTDVLHALFHAVYRAPRYRPDRDRLLELLRGVGAVVLVDDADLSGQALEELAAAAPECAFLVVAPPDAPPLAPDSAFQDVRLSGLSQDACEELLSRAVRRPLAEDERSWAADLWFESEGMPLRFVQAGALLRQRDAQCAELASRLRAADRNPFDPQEANEDDALLDDAEDRTSQPQVPLPTFAQSAAPASRLAADVSEAARETLRFAVALGGQCPNPAHLPALVGDALGDSALAELVSRGLAVPVATHHRLAPGVRTQLEDLPGRPAGYARSAAHYYAWWAAHPSVTVDRVDAEAEVLLATMASCRDHGEHEATVRLALAAAPAFAASLRWGAWERALRLGQEAARQAGDVAAEAYCHHELGVLALCTGSVQRARAELEASIALRGALGDQEGTAAGRRVLGLVPRSPRGRDAEALTAPLPRTRAAATIRRPAVGAARGAARSGPGGAQSRAGRRPWDRLRAAGRARSRRNLAVAGAGALLAVVLGAVVGLTGASEDGGGPRTPLNVGPVDTAQDRDPGSPTPKDSAPAVATPEAGAPPTGATTPGQRTDPEPQRRSWPSSSPSPSTPPRGDRPPAATSPSGSPSASASASRPGGGQTSPSTTTSPSPSTSPSPGDGSPSPSPSDSASESEPPPDSPLAGDPDSGSQESGEPVSR
ncbi:hypothetical protein AQ490_21000 [Wenjunlia vitaminophila]|uniref:Uncharacterized protein n=1 Tax=Wenjunlia vitaminophila TaxID=76728 RepID=A0A0T6LTK1_WENVI|nr:hypothetical protein [Wenjunlia vitaminophila]KRV49454.1 hypothetical protein AQ490_21000 [Wenjunlia vitaminophila]